MLIDLDSLVTILSHGAGWKQRINRDGVTESACPQAANVFNG